MLTPAVGTNGQTSGIPRHAQKMAGKRRLLADKCSSEM